MAQVGKNILNICGEKHSGKTHLTSVFLKKFKGINLNSVKFENKDLKNIQNDKIILDIGLETIKSIKHKIDQSNTVLWNGPAGYFENESFMTGTMSIAEAISENTLKKSLISILGGGDTLAAINKSKNKLSFTHLSTAGGAFLEHLEGKDLPGLSVLK